VAGEAIASKLERTPNTNEYAGCAALPMASLFEQVAAKAMVSRLSK
jgi:hypothetical protein